MGRGGVGVGWGWGAGRRGGVWWTAVLKALVNSYQVGSGGVLWDAMGLDGVGLVGHAFVMLWIWKEVRAISFAYATAVANIRTWEYSNSIFLF